MLHSRITRVEEQLRSELGNILLTEVKDPRIEFVTVVRVKVSKDLRHAIVFVSFLNQETAEEGMKGLVAAKGYIRKKLSEKVHMKYLPDLKFIKDDNTEYAANISRIIEQLDIPEAEEEQEENQKQE